MNKLGYFSDCDFVDAGIITTTHCDDNGVPISGNYSFLHNRPFVIIPMAGLVITCSNQIYDTHIPVADVKHLLPGMTIFIGQHELMLMALEQTEYGLTNGLFQRMDYD